MSEKPKTRRTRSGLRAYVTKNWKELTKVKKLTENVSPDVTIALAQLKLHDKFMQRGRDVRLRGMAWIRVIYFLFFKAETHRTRNRNATRFL